MRMIKDRFSNPLLLLAAGFLLKPYVLACLLGGVAFESYRLLRPAVGDPESVRRQLAAALGARLAAELPRREGIATVAVLEPAGDQGGVVTAALRQAVQAAGTYRLIEEGFLRRMLREFGRDKVPVATLADAVEAARGTGADAVIFGTVAEFAADAHDGRLLLELRMAERDSGRAVFARSYRETVGENYAGLSGWRARMAQSPAGRRILVWAAFTLLLPLLTVPWIRRLTAMESNMVNLGMLIGYTGTDMLFAAFLTGFRISSVWLSALLLVALGAAAYYNYCVASFIAEKSR